MQIITWRFENTDGISNNRDFGIVSEQQELQAVRCEFQAVRHPFIVLMYSAVSTAYTDLQYGKKSKS